MPVTGECSDPIRIRAHHLLCMQGFQGYGYNSEFIMHLEKIIAFFNSYPNSKLQIVQEADEICSCCPNENKGFCNRDTKIGKIDILVIERASIDLKKIYSFEEVQKLVDEDLNHQDIMDICGKCSWKDKCRFFIKKIN
jgi:hypothetical protein